MASEVQSAKSAYERFSEIRAKILSLSRENTNIRSLSLSLNEKRKATVAFQEVLLALEKAIQDEPAAHPPIRPR